MFALRRSTIGLVAAVGLAAGSLVLAPSANAVDVTSPVVISEVFGGGGNAGAPFTNDFVELYNSGAAPFALDGWSVQYASAAGTSWQVTPLSGSVAAGGYYLVQEGAGAGNGVGLPAPDATGTIALSATNGKVALVNSSTALTGCAAACSGSAPVVDFVGFGTANDAVGTPTAALSNTTSAQRVISPLRNTGSNAADFSVASPTPKAAPATLPPPPPTCASTPLPPECTPGATTIQDVQGDGFLSPLKGTTVDRVAGVVTAVRTTGSGRGFWIQEPDPATARTTASSGVFVFTSSAAVSVGDAVLVTGRVSEFYPLSSGETLATTSSLSTTEIAPTLVTTVSAGNPVPAPLVLGPTTVPNTFSPTVSGANIESISPLDPADSAQEFYEAHEGMLVEIDNARVVGPGDQQFGEIYVTSKPDQQATPRGGTYIAGYDKVPSGRLLVAPVSGTVPAANVGDVLSGPTTGPMDWSTFGGYDIAATTVGAYVDHRLTGTVAAAQAADQLAIATYNVKNLSPADPQAKFDRLAQGVVTNLAAPDVVSVEEIQDNSGPTDDGVVAADVTLSKFTAAIVAAGGPSYQWSEVDPVNDQDGGQPGGNIRVVFLYNPDRVTLVKKPGGDSTTPVTVSTAPDGTAALSVSPGRIDPANQAWTSSRKPLAGEFLFRGRKVIIVANHLNSKGGDQSSDGRFQPPDRTSEIQRTQQATELNKFVKSVSAADPTANVVLAGDFNDYQFSGPIATLTDSGATLTDLINTLPENQRYTYNFNGISQVLDHIFISKPITDVRYDVIHINSEFSDQASDHDPQVVRIRPTLPQPVRRGLVISALIAKAGSTVPAVLAGWSPRTRLTLSLDAVTTLGTVTTDRIGAAIAKETIPSATSPGVHRIVVIGPDGTRNQWSVLVTAHQN